MLPIAFTVACLVLTASLVVASRHESSMGTAVTKTGASLAFVATAWSLGATGSPMGRLMLLALCLSVVGDLCLLSRQSRWFLAGLGVFLLAHLAFAAAFASAAPSMTGIAAGAALMLGVSAAALRWLWPHLDRVMRPAVLAYVAAIAAMCALAVGVSVASGQWLIAVGALLFAASDLSVARQAFIAPAWLNLAWGLPAYYAAQMLLAWSVPH
ncbi:MAG TPA: lysoplasmalogenase family protein [Burkholderiaceae bacterium]|jgi:uncharacterized membrane protein YhhN|nr:lysoplasmalogenase family protein [Burkholderiaceae bacterium]